MNEALKTIQIEQTDINGTEGDIIEVELTTSEYCPECENDVELANVFVPQVCPNCLEESGIVNLLHPCSICNHHNCQRCPLDEVEELMTKQMAKRGNQKDLEAL